MLKRTAGVVERSINSWKTRHWPLGLSNGLPSEEKKASEKKKPVKDDTATVTEEHEWPDLF